MRHDKDWAKTLAEEVGEWVFHRLDEEDWIEWDKAGWLASYCEKGVLKQLLSALGEATDAEE
jgi:hypothetical protein